MKKTFFTFAAALVTVFLFSQCQKEDADNARHHTYFWTKTSAEEQPLTLFVDGQPIGLLPNFSTDLTCSNDSLKKQALFMSLKSGKYNLEARNSQGQVKSDGTLKISENGMGMGPGQNLQNTGGMAASWEGSGTPTESSGNSCVIVNLFY